MLIHIQQPQPSGEKIMQVLLQAKKDEEKWNSETNFRLLVINELLKKIKEAR